MSDTTPASAPQEQPFGLPPDTNITMMDLSGGSQAPLSNGLLPDGSHPATPGVTPLYSAPAPQEAPTKATKAIAGTVVIAVGAALAGAASVLPSPYDGYAQGAVGILTIVAGWFGIYLPANKPK